MDGNNGVGGGVFLRGEVVECICFVSIFVCVLYE